jgi:hypothetical protein
MYSNRSGHAMPTLGLGSAAFGATPKLMKSAAAAAALRQPRAPAPRLSQTRRLFSRDSPCYPAVNLPPNSAKRPAHRNSRSSHAASESTIASPPGCPGGMRIGNANLLPGQSRLCGSPLCQFAQGDIRLPGPPYGFVAATRREVFAEIIGLKISNCPFVNLPKSEPGRWGQGLTTSLAP